VPLNLPPEAIEAERRYREAETIPEQIDALEDFLSKIPKHKGTDKLRADLRKRLSKLKDAGHSRKGSTGHESPFHVEREGPGQIVLVGLPNVGKSSLVNALTHASPEVSAAPLSTWTPTPGMMPVEDIQIQLVDTPPLNRDYMDPGLMALIRQADYILLVVDVQADPVGQLQESLDLLAEHRIVPCGWEGRDEDGDRVTARHCLVLANKCDDEGYDENVEIFRALLGEECPILALSAATGRNLDCLRQTLLRELDIVRVYSKPPGQDTDFDAPFVLKRGDTVADLAAHVHRDVADNLKSARLWGSAVHDGQMVGRDHVLQDGDIVELHT